MGYHDRDFMRKRKYAMVSGGFDPIHVGHLRMIQQAARESDGVYVVVNSDEWLFDKKGYVFMPWDHRAELIRGLKGVMDVLPVNDSDGTVCEVVRRVKPDYFVNGGDRTRENTPEGALCEELNIQMLWNFGGEKVQCSRDLVAAMYAVSAVHNIGKSEILHDSIKNVDLYDTDE